MNPQFPHLVSPPHSSHCPALPTVVFDQPFPMKIFPTSTANTTKNKSPQHYIFFIPHVSDDQSSPLGFFLQLAYRETSWVFERDHKGTRKVWFLFPTSPTEFCGVPPKFLFELVACLFRGMILNNVFTSLFSYHPPWRWKRRGYSFFFDPRALFSCPVPSKSSSVSQFCKTSFKPIGSQDPSPQLRLLSKKESQVPV